MPNSKEPDYSNLEMLFSLLDPTYKLGTIKAREEKRKFRELDRIRRGYKGPWNAAAKYFYSELIRAYGLDADCQDFLMDVAQISIELAKIPRGRPRKDDLARLVAELREKGSSYARIANRLNLERPEKIATPESVRKLFKRYESHSHAPRTKSEN